MTYKTPLSKEVQQVLTQGMRELVLPLSKPDRKVWQPVLNCLAACLVRDVQAAEAERLVRVRVFQGVVIPGDSVSTTSADAVVRHVSSIFQTHYGREGGLEQLWAMLDDSREERIQRMQGVNVSNLAITRLNAPKRPEL